MRKILDTTQVADMTHDFVNRIDELRKWGIEINFNESVRVAAEFIGEDKASELQRTLCVHAACEFFRIPTAWGYWLTDLNTGRELDQYQCKEDSERSSFLSVVKLATALFNAVKFNQQMENAD